MTQKHKRHISKTTLQKALNRFKTVDKTAPYFGVSTPHLYYLIRKHGCLLDSKAKSVNAKKAYLDFEGLVTVQELAVEYGISEFKMKAVLLKEACYRWNRQKAHGLPRPGNHYQIKIWKYLRKTEKPWINKDIAFYTASPLKKVLEYRAKINESKNRTRS